MLCSGMPMDQSVAVLATCLDATHMRLLTLYKIQSALCFDLRRALQVASHRIWQESRSGRNQAAWQFITMRTLRTARLVL
jgi:hypothetical protein